jgi:2-keto-3-deoxy-L-rhamnonate aldolase RhmA
MIENRIKHALQQNEAVFGTGLTGPIDLPVLRTLANCEVDWLFLDLEHGSLDISELLTIVQTADLLGMCSVLRIPSLEYHWVARALDTGSLAVMVPRVETVDQARQAVQWAKFPPQGTRGMGSPTFLSYARMPYADGLEISNRESMVVLQIESIQAVDNVEAIAAVPGVDALFIGPLDLSISLGKPGDVTSEESHQAFRRVCQAAQTHGLAVGVVCKPDQVGMYYEMGIRMFSVGTALSHMRTAMEASVADFRRQVQKR